MILALLAAVPAAVAQGQGIADRELQDELEEVFEVLPLSSGFVLQPRDSDADYRSLEITADGSVLIDGKAPDETQSLRDLLGTAAYRALVKVRRLDEAQRRELFVATAEGRQLPEAEDLAPAAPAAPSAPATPGVPGVPDAPGIPPAAPGPAMPAPPAPPTPPRIHSDAKVSVGGGVTVGEDEIVTEDVVTVGGPLDVQGEVQGDAVSMGGPVTIDGRITGEVVAMGGDVTLGPEADIGGDVTSVGGQVHRDPSAQVGGRVREIAVGSGGLGILRGLRHLRHRDDDEEDEGWDFSPVGHFTGLLWKLFAFIVTALFACLFMLVARTPMERIERKVEEEPWKSGLVGLVAQIAFLPLLAVTCVILAVSIIGIPLLLLVPFVIVGLVVVAFLGFVAVAYRVGRWAQVRFNWQPHNEYWVLVVGLALVGSFGFVSRALDFRPLGGISVMLAIVGFLVQYAAATVGFGGALLTRFGAGPRISRMAPPPPPPPVEPVSEPAPLDAPAAADVPLDYGTSPYESKPWDETAPGESRDDDSTR
jgi:hypothetical protein